MQIAWEELRVVDVVDMMDKKIYVGGNVKTGGLVMQTESNKNYLQKKLLNVEELLRYADDVTFPLEELKQLIKEFENTIVADYKRYSVIKNNKEINAFVVPVLGKIKGKSTKSHPRVNKDNIICWLNEIEFELDYCIRGMN